MTDKNLDDFVVDEVKKVALENGLNPDDVKRKDISTEKIGKNIHIKWKDIQFELPAPSQEAVDSWFKAHGGDITKAAIALGTLATAGYIVTKVVKSNSDTNMEFVKNILDSVSNKK